MTGPFEDKWICLKRTVGCVGRVALRFFRHTTYADDAARAAATETVIRCSSSASRVGWHCVCSGTPHTPMTRLAPLLQRP